MNLFSQKLNKIEDYLFRKSYFSLVKRVCTSLLEVGAHQGEVMRYFSGQTNVQVISYEANPYDFSKFDLENIGVRHSAVLDSHEKEISFKIPRRGWQSMEDAHSGKGAVLDRQDGDFDQFKMVTVPSVNINEPIRRVAG